MNNDQTDALNGELLTSSCLTLQQLCTSSAMQPDFIIELVEYEVLTPEGERAINWRFNSTDLMRLRKAKRLLHDFELNITGLALVMQLLDEISELRNYSV